MKFMLMMWSLLYLLNYLMILLSVMFFTMLERKILSYTQMRVGPNKLFFMGLMQPLMDGLKLIINEKIISYKINKMYYYMGPFILLMIMLSMWLMSMIPWLFISLNYYLMMFMSCLGISIYSSLLSGWASNSKYSMIGSIRSLAQTISYELTLIFCILIFISPTNSLNFKFLLLMKFSTMGILMPLFNVWMMNIVAECGRAPFDFIEGESELVSGFNTEFSSSGFALLFVGEYGLIIFFSLMSCIFMSNMKIIMYFMIFLMLISFLIIRSSLPRFRYDYLMNMVWMKLLPLSIFYLGFMFFIFS